MAPIVAQAVDTECRAALFAGAKPDPGLLTFARGVSELAEAAGYRPRQIDAGTLTDETRLAVDAFDLLILVDGRRLPAGSVSSILRYLRSGGDLLAIGLPLWDQPLFQVGDQWLSRAEYQAALDAQIAQHVIADFEQTDLRQWTRFTDNPQNPVRHRLERSGGGQALHVTIDRVTGWETFSSPTLTQPFPPGHTLTCLRARGSAETPQLALEWTEHDGSRWIAVIDLTPDWRNLALPPEAFKAWMPSPGRGGAGDRLEVTNAARFVVGVARSHTALRSPRQEYWIDDLGTARNPFGNDAPPGDFEPPRLESLCPAYQFFPVTPPVVVKPSHEKAALEDWERSSDGLRFGPALEERLWAIHPRPRGVGFNQDRPWRWEPLLGAYDLSSSDYRGALGVLVVNLKPPFRGSVWTGFVPSAPDFYDRPLITKMLRQTLIRMRRGVFLAEGGTDPFTPLGSLLEAEGGDHAAVGEVLNGARMVNFGRVPVTNLWLEIEHPSTRRPGRAWARHRELSLDVNEEYVWSEAGPFDGVDCNQVTIGLGFTAPQAAGRVDALIHEVGVWPGGGKWWKPDPQFIEVRDGRFWLGDEPWKAHGVNYMPSSGIGLASQEYFEHWLGRGAYDPSVIQRDLERIRALGLNAVSAFLYHRSLEGGHLLDLLRRCRDLGLRVNLSLRPGTPMDFRWNEMKALIEHFDLAHNNTVFAYDLAWEPSHHDEAYQQQHYTRLWQEWVLARHGSLASAAVVWEHHAPTGQPDADVGTDIRALTVPPMSWLTQDGPWRKIVADYRKFLDQLVHARYAEARRLVQSVDARHPVSFRMQHAGDPTHNAVHLLPYDFAGLAGAVDIWEPEAYGRIGAWDRVKAGHFTAAYARLWDPSIPMVWAEMGYNVWDPRTMSPSPDGLAFTAQYYQDFYRMLRESGADGVFFWWYPGGYRLNERSDYGIINPDGTDRAVTRVIREEGPRFLRAPKPPPPDYWIEIDRNRDARGLPGIYDRVKDQYWRALEQGKTPGLRRARNPARRP